MLNKNILRDVFTCKKPLGIVLISDFVQALLMATAAFIMAYLANGMLFAQLDETAVPLLVLLFFIMAAKSCLAYYNNLQVEAISLQIQTKLRLQLLKQLAYDKDHHQLNKSQWVAVILKGVDKLDVYINNFLPQLGILIVTPLTFLLFAFYLDWLSALIFTCTAPLIPLFMILIGKIAQKENLKQWDKFQKLSAFMVDFLPGILVLKAYNQVEQQLINLKAKGEEFSTTTLKVLKIAFLSAFMLELITTLSIALIAVNIGLRLIYGEAQFLPLMVILLLAPQFYNPLRQFGSAFHDGMNGLTAAGEIYSIIGHAPSTITNESKGLAKPSIEFKNISFSYEAGEVLKDVSFKLEFGEQVVLTGPNGGGKSTIFKLLLGLLKPKGGKILINGEDLARINKEDFYGNLGYIPQSPTLFTASLRENIILGRKISEEQLAKVLKAVNLADFGSAIGLDTVLDKGMKISSGQMRRLGLARALVTEPEILLLDEPMENLDGENEEMIQNILKSLRGKATVIIIGHRQQTIFSGDKIMYLDEGQITFAQGPAEFGKVCNLREANNV